MVGGSTHYSPYISDIYEGCCLTLDVKADPELENCMLVQKQGKKELLHNSESGFLVAEDHSGLRCKNCAVQHLALCA